MSKKLSKLLFTTALAGAAIAGGVAYLNKCKNTNDSMDEEFDDFEDDFDMDELTEEHTPSSREYVTIPKEGPSEEEPDTEETEAEKTASAFEEEATSSASETSESAE